MSEPSETEAVGYKRPPSKSQFKPGKSGNPRGRPKRKVNMSESLHRALDEKIIVTETGKALTKLDVLVQSLVDRVLQGDARAIPALARLLNKTEQFKPKTRPAQMTGVVVVRPDYFDDPPVTGNFTRTAQTQSQSPAHPVNSNLGGKTHD